MTLSFPRPKLRHTHIQKGKHSTEVVPQGCCSAPVSVCVIHCQKDKQNLHHCAAGTPSKNFQIPFNSSARRFWQEPNSPLMHFKVQPLQTNRFLASTGFCILGLFKAYIELNVAAVEWRFRIMKPYLHHVGSSLTPSQWRDLRTDPQHACFNLTGRK